MVLTAEQITEVVDSIQGSCKSLDEAVYSITDGELNRVDQVENWRELCDAVDRAHFQCVQCGWWCEVGDYAENQDNPGGDICSDCGSDEED